MAKSDTQAKTLREAGIQRFETREVHRSLLVNAPYNPRVITETEKKKLRKILERNGLVSPITWNERTGHIVGGHQRIAILDSLMGTKDYSLDVAVIDVDESREKELNIAMNNTVAMGSFDLEGLRNILEDQRVTLDGTGFDHTDMIRTFGETVFDNREEDLAKFAASLAEISDHYSAVIERNAALARSEKYLVFVFPTGAHVEELLKAAGLPDDRYQNGMVLMDKWGVLEPQKDRDAQG